MPRTTWDVEQKTQILGEAPLALRVLGCAEVIHLSGPRRTIGSASECDLVLDDPYVSRRHCLLTWEPDGALWIKDEGSRNGTWVNSVRVERCAIAPRSRIVVGRSALQLLGPADADGRELGMVGEHPAMRKVVRQIQRYAATRHPVVILGETGTGKELAARAIHRLSDCADGPFEAINCAAIPQELAESELFGHVRGAFTGADRAHSGAFQRADGGTLLLDEVGEMPLALQPKLLRAIEEGAVQPVGAQERRSVSIRVLAATHRDLEQEASKGRFRIDLYHRLAVCEIRIPPLRARASDIPLLVSHFIEQLQQPDAPPATLDPDLLPYLAQQSWPGNVRQLQAALKRALVLGDTRIGRHDFAFLCGTQARDAEPGYVHVDGRTYTEIQRQVYLDAIRRAGGNRSAAAADLGIAKSTFFDHLRLLQIDPSEWS